MQEEKVIAYASRQLKPHEQNRDLCFKDLTLIPVWCKVRGIHGPSKPQVPVYSEGFEYEAAEMG